VEEIACNYTNLKYLSLKGYKRISEEVMKKLNLKIKIEYPLPLLWPIFTTI
ncbi:15495_t:CDS:2, partial [Racocetra fulgida]